MGALCGSCGYERTWRSARQLEQQQRATAHGTMPAQGADRITKCNAVLSRTRRELSPER